MKDGLIGIKAVHLQTGKSGGMVLGRSPSPALVQEDWLCDGLAQGSEVRACHTQWCLAGFSWLILNTDTSLIWLLKKISMPNKKLRH